MSTGLKNNKTPQKNLCIYPYQLSPYKKVLEKRFPQIKFQTIDTDKLRQDLKGILGRNFWAFDKVVLLTYDLDLQGRTLSWALLLLWLAKKEAYFIDTQERVKKISWARLFFYCLPAFFLEAIPVPFLLLKIKRKLRALDKAESLASKRPLEKKYPKIGYLRTNYWFGISAGGSVGHIAGVANGFLAQGFPLFFISTDKLKLIDESRLPIYLVRPKGSGQNFREISEFKFNFQLVKEVPKIFLKEKPEIIYHRYSRNSYAGVILAQKFNLPLILEYNGSEIWVAKNWEKGLRFQKLTQLIEEINLKYADLIVVVSDALRDELLSRGGIPASKILVSPNGVDTEKFNPEIDGSQIRDKFRLQNKIIVGFISTFSSWHGAEVLAKAVKYAVERNPNIHFLFVGDGPLLDGVKSIIKNDGVCDFVTFTGLVPQEGAPEYLASCDILVSPHIPNPDGSAFFGSPTKLFEYMAMGKAIVASNLDQIGKVLENEINALLVEPGDVAELVGGILRLVQDKDLRERLGRNARVEVVKNYTWEENAKRVIEFYEQRFKAKS